MDERATVEFPCGLLSVDDERVIVGANAAGAALLGAPAEELIGARLDALLTPSARIFFDTHLYPLLALAGHADEIYLSLRARSGEALPVLLNAVRVEAPGGVENRFAFLPMRRRQLFERELVAARREALTAVSAEHDAQARLREAQSQLMLRERLASIGTLAAGVAHEINNPLAYVHGSLEVMSEALRAPGPLDEARVADLRELAGAAREGTARIRSIIDAMRLLSRHDGQGGGARFDPREAVELALRLSGHALRHATRVEVHVDPAPAVTGDAGRLSQVIINLLVNAAQAMPPDRAGNRIDVTVGTTASGDALVEVRDNGAGIAPELLGRIFDPFFTTKPVGEGTGLGLAVCHGIVAALGGALSVESTPGEGSRFRVVLPAAPDEVAPSAPPPSAEAPRVAPSPPPEGRSRPRVLIVDDEAAVTKILCRALSAYDCVSENRGAEAIARVEAGERFDLVLCDLMMPGTTGMDVFAAIARAAPALVGRVVFMTGGAFTSAAQDFLDGVPNARVTKPFEVAALRATCARVIAGG